MVGKDITDPEEIRAVILRVSRDLHLDLAAEDVDRLVQLMLEVQSLNLNINQLSGQLENLHRDLSEVRSSGRMLWQMLQEWLMRIRSGLGRLGDIF